MEVFRVDVEEALKDVRLIKGLVAQARGEMFRGGAPFFLIWGVVWMIGYLLPIVGAPDGWRGPLWLSLDFLGFAASVIVGARSGRKIGPMPYLARKWMWSGLVGLWLAVVSIVAPFLPVAYPVQVAAVAVFGATAMIGSGIYGLRRHGSHG